MDRTGGAGVIAPALVKRVVLNELQRCGGCGGVVEAGVHVDSRRADCGWDDNR